MPKTKSRTKQAKGAKPAKRAKLSPVWEDLDWWVTEKVSTAQFFSGGPEQLDEELFIGKLKFPIRRRNHRVTFVAEFNVSRTVREWIQVIYDFYQRPVPGDDFPLYKAGESEEDPYYAYLEELESVKYVDLLTRMPDQGRGSGDVYTEEMKAKGEPDVSTDKPDRSRLMCSGLVRFDGLRREKKDSYKIILGA